MYAKIALNSMLYDNKQKPYQSLSEFDIIHRHGKVVSAYMTWYNLSRIQRIKKH